ncbi:MAG: 23S rRNA (uracil(1939)-C(5))-methyltransferase RlmD, partial [Clostridiales bacterium]|nr:23S rRNA (uracil(1939)-C(5))-methyltransferase RlmD [Clostridiales bacterium]
MKVQIHKDKLYEIEIIDLTDKGEGIGKIDDLAVFIDGAVPGDHVKIKISQLKKNYGIGEIVEIISESEIRTKPLCMHFEDCGGCQVQNIKYEEQLKIKKQIVKDALDRIGHQNDYELFDTIGMENPYGYRNKSSFPLDSEGNMGFYKKRSHDLIEIEDCVIQGNLINKVMKEIQRQIKILEISIYNETSHKGMLRHVVIRESKSKSEVMVIFVTNGKSLNGLEILSASLMNSFPEVISIYQNINKDKGNRIMGFHNQLISGEAEIIDKIKEYSFKISPNSFFQVNNSQTEKLYQTALDYAELKGDEIIFDLYCGIGTITHFLAEKAKKVYGIEIVGEAIDDAIENTKLNQLDNIEYILGRAEEEIDQLYYSRISPNIVVVDPPRRGLDTKLIDKIIEIKPEKIVYVSCKPSTLARDVAVFTANGYKLIKAQPVDMFPHTM